MEKERWAKEGGQNTDFFCMQNADLEMGSFWDKYDSELGEKLMKAVILGLQMFCNTYLADLTSVTLRTHSITVLSFLFFLFLSLFFQLGKGQIE